MKRNEYMILILVLSISIIVAIMLFELDHSDGDDADNGKIMDIENFEEYGDPLVEIMTNPGKGQFLTIKIKNSENEEVELTLNCSRYLSSSKKATINSVTINDKSKVIECLDFSKISEIQNIDYTISITSTAFNDVAIKKIISASKVMLNGFQGNKTIEHVDLSGQLQLDIGGNSYNGCSNLTEIKLPRLNYTIGTAAFNGCTSLTQFDLTGCTMVNYSAFSGSGLKNIEIGGSLTEGEQITLGGSAFADCSNLKNITIGNAILKEKTFANCWNLSQLTITKNLSFDTSSNNSFSYTGLVSVTIPDGLSIPSSTFYTCSQLEEVTFGDDLIISPNAFSNCEKLSKVNFGKNNVVGEYAFDNCVTLGTTTDDYKFDLDGVISISSGAFRDCTSITSLIIPASMTSLEYDAFEGCVGIKELSLDPANASFCLVDGVLYSPDKTELIMANPAKTELTLPKETTKIGGFEYDSDTNVVSNAGQRNALSALSLLTSINVEDGNQVFVSDDKGCLMSSGCLIFVPRNISPGGELTIQDYTVKKFAFNQVNLRSIVFRNSLLEACCVFICDVDSIEIYSTNQEYEMDCSFYCESFSKMVFLDKLTVTCDGDISVSRSQVTLSGNGFLPGVKERQVTIQAKNITIKTSAFKSQSEDSSFLEKLSLVANESITIEDSSFQMQTSLKELLLVAGEKVQVPEESSWMSFIIAGTGGKVTEYGSKMENVYIDSKQFTGEMFETDASIWVSPELSESFTTNVAGHVKYDPDYGIALNDGKLKHDSKDIYVLSPISGVSVNVSNNSFTITTGDLHSTNDLVVKVNGVQVNSGENGSYSFGNINEQYIIIVVTEKPDSTNWHIVTFDSGISKSTIYVSDGHSILSSMVPTITRNGYRLDGWFLDSELKENYFESNDRAITKDICLYASWTSLGNYLDVDDSAGTFYYQKDGKQEIYVRGTYSSGTLVLTFVPKTGYTLYGFDNISSEDVSIDGDTITVKAIGGYVCLKPLTKYVSSSTDLEYVVEQKSPKQSDDVILIWSFDGGKVSQSGMVWSGMPSVPLIIDEFVYIQVNDEIYKLNASTGAKIKSITTGYSTTQFYHYLGYGGGYIVDYTSSNVYTEDLDLVCSIPEGITYLVWHDGYFYGISNGNNGAGVIYKMNPSQTTKASDSSVAIMDNLWNNETKKVNVIQSLFGTTAHPVIEGDVMYYISTEGKKIFINALDLGKGEFSTKDLEIEGYYLDDGWLTYYNGHLYITAYANSLFGEGMANKTSSMIGYMKVDGTTIGEVSYVYLGSEDGKNTNDSRYKSLTSAFVIQNGRGYVNVTAGLAERSGVQGYFMVYNIGDDGKPVLDKIVSSTSSHGSLVASTYYYDDATKSGDVYIYLLNYSADQNIRIFKDTCVDGKWTLSQYVSVSGVEPGFGSQAVRVGTEGQLIFYNDSGKVFCYASTGFASRYGFFVDDGDTAEVKIGEGADTDPVKALEQAIANSFGIRNIELNTENGTVDIVGQKYHVYYYGTDGIAHPVIYSKTLDAKDLVKIRTFYLSRDVSSAEDLDPDVEWDYVVTENEHVTVHVKDIVQDLRSYEPMTIEKLKPYVSYGYDDEYHTFYGKSGDVVELTLEKIPTKKGYTFVGFTDGETIYKYTVEGEGITSPSYTLKGYVILEPVWFEDGKSFNSVEVKIGDDLVVEDSDSIELLVGFDDKITVSMDGSGVSTISSSNSNVIKIDGGRIITLKAGKAVLTITISSPIKEQIVSVEVNVVEPTSSKVDMSKSSISLYKGASTTLSASTDLKGVGVIWTSSDPRIAMVDSNGKVTAISEGVALITATAADDSDVKAVCTVTVSLKKVTSISLSQTSKTMKVGDSSTLSATIAPSDAEDKRVTWSSSNPSVVSVTASGAIQALSKGTAIVTATTVDGSFSASCTVKVEGTVSSISLDKTMLRLEVGSNSTLKATTYPDEALSSNISWTSSDASIVSVSGGYVYAYKVGTATITVSYGDLTATCTVIVSEKSVVKEDTKENTDGSKTVTKEEKTVSGDSTITTNTEETKDKDDKSMGSDVKISAESENKAVKTEATVKKDADGKVIESNVKTTVEAKIQTKDGKEIVTVSKEDILSAVDQIGAVKNTAGGNVEPVIVIDIGKASTASSSSIDLSYESLVQIADGNDTTLRVNTSAGTLEMSSDVISTLSSDGSDLKLGIEKVSDEGVTKTIKDKVKDSTVFSLTATLGKTSIHQLGGKVSVSLPYALKGTVSSDVRIYHVDDDGTLKEMSCKYDANSGMVSFVTDHFSYFVVSEESLVSDAADSDNGISEMNTLLKIVIGLLAVLIAMAAIAMFVHFRGN